MLDGDGAAGQTALHAWPSGKRAFRACGMGPALGGAWRGTSSPSSKCIGLRAGGLPSVSPWRSRQPRSGEACGEAWWREWARMPAWPIEPAKEVVEPVVDGRARREGRDGVLDTCEACERRASEAEAARRSEGAEAPHVAEEAELASSWEEPPSELDDWRHAESAALGIESTRIG